jgi:limonene-1,2-epoxide hydrolase
LRLLEAVPIGASSSSTNESKSMTTKQIADRLVALCRKADYETAQKELYATDALSVEPQATPVFAKETKGLDQILEKGKKFSAMVETMHANEVSEPIVAGQSFACVMRLDVTMKGKGRMDMKELCIYDVKDGKIVREEFRM